MDIYGFYKGEAFEAYEYLGAHVSKKETAFRTYAPNASKVSVIGDFSGWNDIPMERIEDGRFLNCTVPRLKRECAISTAFMTDRENFLTTATLTDSEWNFARGLARSFAA